MRSSLKPVRLAFKNLLSGLGYAVYDRNRKINDYPNIVIGEVTEIQAGSQSTHGQEVTINIELHDGWVSDYGERDNSDDMVDEIMQAVITKPYVMEIPGFDMPSLVLDNTMTSTEQTDTHTLVTTVMRFKMHLFENGLNEEYILDEDGNKITDTNNNLILAA